jgi:ADP-ribosylglycohydrolase
MSFFEFFKKLNNKNKEVPGKKNEQSDSGTYATPFSRDTTTILLADAMNLYMPDFTPKDLGMSREALTKYILFGVTLGDVAGSQYEGVPFPGRSVSEMRAEVSSQLNREYAYPEDDCYKDIDMFTEFNHITDDTVLTFAIYKATQYIISENITDESEIVNIYTKYLHKYHHAYPNAGYAGGFDDWAWSETTERNYSYGNGSCMRVGGVAVLFDDIEDVIRYAYYSALPSHSHKEGIKGAICTAVIYWMLAYGASKNDVTRYLEKTYPNDGRYQIHAHTQLEDLVNMNRVDPWSTLSVICQTSVTEAVINFLESNSFESCLRNSYRYLCDRDTIAAISGPMAAIFYKEMNVQGRDGEEVARSYLTTKLLSDMDD